MLSQLITCDIVCLGVGSPGLFSAFVEWLGGRHGSQVVAYQHRGHGEPWGTYEEKCELADGQSLCGRTDIRSWKRVWSRLTVRKSCGVCAYHSLDRTGSLTIGDYWGIDEKLPGLSDSLGASCILVNDETGRDTLKRLRGRIELVSSSVGAVANARQPMLTHPRPQTGERDIFLADAVRFGYCHACRRVGALGATRVVKDAIGILRQRLKHNTAGIAHCQWPESDAWDALEEGKLPLAFAARNLDDEIRWASSSGGMYHALASYVIAAGGVVYGCAFDDSIRARHVRCETMKDCERCMGSKYSQSDMGNTIAHVREDLLDGRTVLFTGTPCQVDAVRNACDGAARNSDDRISSHVVTEDAIPQAHRLRAAPGKRLGVLGHRMSDVRLPQPNNSEYRYRDGRPLGTFGEQGSHASTRYRNWHKTDESMRGKLPELYAERVECCGCTGCLAACPKGAIRMEPDEEGFDYPVVDASLCVGCSRCIRACAFGRRQCDA